MAAIAFPGASGAAPRSWGPRLVPAGRSIEGTGVPRAPRRAVSAATYRRRRVVVAAAAIGLLFATHVAAGVATNLALAVIAPQTAQIAVAPAPPPATAAQRIHVVQPGDTIWDVARRFQPDGDVRPLVDAMVQARGGRPLQVGERLLVP